MTTHRAAVCGSPIRHSLSPVLHDAAYRALGLTNWTYGRIHIEAEELAEWVHSLDDSWRGLSLTMPLKEAAFAVAHTVSEVAEAVGAINTLVRDDDGWSGHNTDVYGIVRALAEAGVTDITHAVVVGSGATARSALAALAEVGALDVSLMVRAAVRPDTASVARLLGLGQLSVPMGRWPEDVDVVIGTVPPHAYAAMLQQLPRARHVAAVLDCVYGQGVSPLLAAGAAKGYVPVSGTEMLLHQAAEQVRLMTGQAPPVAAMRAALQAATADH